MYLINDYLLDDDAARACLCRFFGDQQCCVTIRMWMFVTEEEFTSLPFAFMREEEVKTIQKLT